MEKNLACKPKLVITVNNWHSAREVFSEFIQAHPELGLTDSPVAFRNFCCRHGKRLTAEGVMRKTAGIRSPAIFDVQRFDDVAYDLITSWSSAEGASHFSGDEK